MVISTINLPVRQMLTSLSSSFPAELSSDWEWSTTVPEASLKHTKAW